MMISNLPLDLVDEILTRVPATSLNRLRTTCRRWYALFKDQRFTEKHFRKAPKESMVGILKEHMIFPMSVNLNVSPPSIEIRSALCLKEPHSNSEQVDIDEVFHCEGLLLCTTKDKRLVVWNPCSGESRWIQYKDDIDRYNLFTLGYIQNNKSCRSYKILRLSGYYYNDPRFEIYEFSSDSWQVLDDAVLDCVIESNSYRVVSSLKGRIYWLANDKKDGHKLVISFDFGTARFKRLCFPIFKNHGCVTLSVGRQGQLKALNENYKTREIEIWLTNRIDAETDLLWSKSFVVDLPKSFELFESLLIDEEKKVSMFYTIDDITNRNLVYIIGEDAEYYTNITFTNKRRRKSSRGWLPGIFNYVPSLFQIQ